MEKNNNNVRNKILELSETNKIPAASGNKSHQLTGGQKKKKKRSTQEEISKSETKSPQPTIDTKSLQHLKKKILAHKRNKKIYKITSEIEYRS